MESELTVKSSIDADGIATVVLSRVASANALNSQMSLELREAFIHLSRKSKVIILTGDGDRAFCAGADLKERDNFTVEQWQVQHQRFRHALRSIMMSEVPVIAAVNGVAYGGGLELALGCDFIYASRTASFAFPEVTLGIMPGMGGTQQLPRAVGTRRAKELLLTGKPFSALEAYNFGVVNQICEPENLIKEVMDCAKLIAQNAPMPVASIKRIVAQGIHQSIDDGLLIESSVYNSLLGTSDRKEGVSAFHEKRKPVFTGK